MRMVPIGNQECSCLRQICSSLNDLFKLKRLVWLKVMLPMIFFLADNVFPVISLLEKIDYC